MAKHKKSNHIKMVFLFWVTLMYPFSTLTAQIVINEIDSDTPGSDTFEFIELYDGGTGNTDLSGLIVVFFNGNGDVSYRTIDLSGFKTDSSGFFVLGNSGVANVQLTFANGMLQNGPDAIALYKANASDFSNGTAVTTANLLDAVVYDTNDDDDPGLLILLNAGQWQVNEGGLGDKDNHSIQRIPNGTGGARNTTTFDQLPPTPGSVNIGAGETREATIHEIQGSGLSSPLRNKSVITKNNIVTTVLSNGFFMQTPDAQTDNNPLTSEGLFVFTGSNPAVSTADLINVAGRVVEFSGQTEITDNPKIEIIASGNSMPEPVVFDSALPSPNQPQSPTEFERYESMIITISEGKVTGPSDQFGVAKIVAGPNRAFREPGIAFPGLPGLPIWDGNPEIFELNPDGAGQPNIQIPAAAVILEATGVLTFNSGNYRLAPTSLSLSTTITPRAVREPQNQEETIGTFNLQNFFDDDDNPSINETVLITKEYAKKLNKLSLQICNVLKAPNILAVQEAENLNVLKDLADKIQADDPSIVYTPYLEEGNEVGGIDVGFMVRRSVVVDSITQIGKNATFNFNGQEHILFDRPPLILDGKLASTDIQNIRVMVVHNRSLSGIESSDSSRVRTKRFEQAKWLSLQIQTIQNNDPEVNLVVLGDFNAFEFTDGYADVMGQITGNLAPAGAQLAGTDEVEPNLENQVLNIPEKERYSFVFAGSAQVLDHILTSQSLKNAVTGIQFSRGNADAPQSFADSSNTPLRSSDHDGLVLYLNLGLINAINRPNSGSPPSSFALIQNYPNPFNPTTTIHYKVAKETTIEIAVFNILGQKIRTLVNQVQERGAYKIQWNGENDEGQSVPSGIYVLRMKTVVFFCHKKNDSFEMNIVFCNDFN